MCISIATRVPRIICKPAYTCIYICMYIYIYMCVLTEPVWASVTWKRACKKMASVGVIVAYEVPFFREIRYTHREREREWNAHAKKKQKNIKSAQVLCIYLFLGPQTSVKKKMKKKKTWHQNEQSHDRYWQIHHFPKACALWSISTCTGIRLVQFSFFFMFGLIL